MIGLGYNPNRRIWQKKRFVRRRRRAARPVARTLMRAAATAAFSSERAQMNLGPVKPSPAAKGPAAPAAVMSRASGQ